MDGFPADSGPDISTRRRSSPVRFFHVVLFVLGGGLASLWSRWGLVLVAIGGVAGFVALKARASTLDMSRERLGLEQLHDDLIQLRAAVEHPDTSDEGRLGALEVLHRHGWVSPAEHEAQQKTILGQGPDPAPPDS